VLKEHGKEVQQIWLIQMLNYLTQAEKCKKILKNQEKHGKTQENNLEKLIKHKIPKKANG